MHVVTPAETSALADARGYALANRVVISQHARRRMEERGVEPEDVYSALLGARLCTSDTRGGWRVSGADRSGDVLTVVIRITSGVLVVTVF